VVVDSSSLVAILLGENEADEFGRRIYGARTVALSAANYVETCMVLTSRGSAEVLDQFDRLLESAGVRVEPVTREDAALARDAFLRFGEGRHPAGLNFGDCFSYALAKRLNEPLLFKGDDFSKTDIQLA